MSPPESANSRSNDFRFVYANTFVVMFSPVEVQLIAGIQNNPGSADARMEEQVGLVMPHAAAKQIVEMMRILLEDLEDQLGAPIPVDMSKMTELKAMVAANQLARAAAAAPVKARTPRRPA